MGEKQDIVDKDNRFWIREDGALCWGDGCLIARQDGKDLRISIDDSVCGDLALEAYGGLIEKTIGKGGKTIFEVPGKIEREPEPPKSIHVKPKRVTRVD